jgi:transposase
LKRYQEVIDLYRKGKSYRSIARQLNLHRMTVARYVQAGSFPEHARRFYDNQARPFAEILRQRWNEGCCNAAELTRELRTKGFTGSYWSVKRRVAPWRSEPPNETSSESYVTMPSPSSRQVARWFLANPVELESDVRTFLNDLWAKCPFLGTTAALSQEFKTIIQDRQSRKLEDWIQKTLNLTVPPEFKRFAQGLEKDEAVKAALELPWSNGQVEGQINRLKLIKRQMYGRAGFDLLRRRVLHRD